MNLTSPDFAIDDFAYVADSFRALPRSLSGECFATLIRARSGCSIGAAADSVTAALEAGMIVIRQDRIAANPVL